MDADSFGLSNLIGNLNILRVRGCYYSKLLSNDLFNVLEIFLTLPVSTEISTAGNLQYLWVKIHYSLSDHCLLAIGPINMHFV